MAETSTPLPYKAVDITRTTKYGIVASSLQEFLNKAIEKFGASFSTAVLEEDGTMVDQEYFQTLPPNTCLMVLKDDEKWISLYKHNPLNNFENQDSTDGTNCPRLAEILARVKNDLSEILLLSIKDLELLSEMDIDSFGDVPNKEFLKQVQEASIRFVNDKRDAKDAIDAVQLLKTYHTNDAGSTTTTSNLKSHS